MVSPGSARDGLFTFGGMGKKRKLSTCGSELQVSFFYDNVLIIIIIGVFWT